MTDKYMKYMKMKINGMNLYFGIKITIWQQNLKGVGQPLSQQWKNRESEQIYLSQNRGPTNSNDVTESFVPVIYNQLIACS